MFRNIGIVKDRWQGTVSKRLLLRHFAPEAATRRAGMKVSARYEQKSQTKRAKHLALRAVFGPCLREAGRLALP